MDVQYFWLGSNGPIVGQLSLLNRIGVKINDNDGKTETETESKSDTETEADTNKSRTNKDKTQQYTKLQPLGEILVNRFSP